ncbi:hypothetical protein DL546_000678 [Coniochaeta pulveracea]|uniref:Uncharacterized protein n=1 Tax=Coniochaeta pulveracea TaxID=177199 RepID=A0A420Y332_9PEZI|nr:hypothetical protein DL546_000678 [Coniochaeta pulveracea]
MAKAIFFVRWALWQQMTFVLAMSIVIVFLMGLGKLWWNNRLTRRQELLDEEKRSRMSEVRRTGVSLKKRSEIPFGVRAIQGGVEVDGIWISRPTTSSSEDNKPKLVASSATTLIGLDATDWRDKGKTADMDSFEARHRLTDAESLASNRTPRHCLSPPPNQRNGVTGLNSSRQLNGYRHSRPTYETYVPTRNLRRPGQRSTASSSSGESIDSQPRSSPRSGSGGSYISTGSTGIPSSRLQYEPRLDDFGTPASHASVSPLALNESQSPLLPGWGLRIPEPTFGPGDIHLNRTARRVNQGFEVLPAGTFGLSPELQATQDGVPDSDDQPTRRSNKRPRSNHNSNQNF